MTASRMPIVNRACGCITTSGSPASGTYPGDKTGYSKFAGAVGACVSAMLGDAVGDVRRSVAEKAVSLVDHDVILLLSKQQHSSCSYTAQLDSEGSQSWSRSI